MGLVCRVQSDITGASSFRIGDASNLSRFGSMLGLTTGLTTGFEHWSDITLPIYKVDTPILITRTGGTFTGGSVQVNLWCVRSISATS